MEPPIRQDPMEPPKVLRSDVNISFGTAAKLAKALEMDFFPELREKKGARYLTPCAKLDVQGV